MGSFRFLHRRASPDSRMRWNTSTAAGKRQCGHAFPRPRSPSCPRARRGTSPQAANGRLLEARTPHPGRHFSGAGNSTCKRRCMVRSSSCAGPVSMAPSVSWAGRFSSTGSGATGSSGVNSRSTLGAYVSTPCVVRSPILNRSFVRRPIRYRSGGSKSDPEALSLATNQHFADPEALTTGPVFYPLLSASLCHRN